MTGWADCDLDPDFSDLLDDDMGVEPAQLVRVRFRTGPHARTYTYSCPFDVVVGSVVLVPTTVRGRNSDTRAVVSALTSSYRGPVKTVSSVITAEGGGRKR